MNTDLNNDSFQVAMVLPIPTEEVVVMVPVGARAPTLTVDMVEVSLIPRIILLGTLIY